MEFLARFAISSTRQLTLISRLSRWKRLFACRKQFNPKETQELLSFERNHEALLTCFHQMKCCDNMLWVISDDNPILWSEIASYYKNGLDIKSRNVLVGIKNCIRKFSLNVSLSLLKDFYESSLNLWPERFLPEKNCFSHFLLFSGQVQNFYQINILFLRYLLPTVAHKKFRKISKHQQL